jgi:hypothetical protein
VSIDAKCINAKDNGRTIIVPESLWYDIKNIRYHSFAALQVDHPLTKPNSKALVVDINSGNDISKRMVFVVWRYGPHAITSGTRTFYVIWINSKTDTCIDIIPRTTYLLPPKPSHFHFLR